MQPAEDDVVGAFGGMAGRVLAESMAPATIVTGIVLAGVLGIGGSVLAVTRQFALVLPFVQVVMALALARFALNGLAGDWSGTVLSTRGGSWGRVLEVALRYGALTVVWLLPLLLLGLNPAALVPRGGGLPFTPPSPGTMTVFILYAVASLLSPPVFLGVALHAETMGDVFRGGTWRRLLLGRRDDLYLVYVVHLGGLAMLAVMSLPTLAWTALFSARLAQLMVVATLVFALGFAVSLLGRLAGFFAVGAAPPAEGGEAASATAAPASPPALRQRAAAAVTGSAAAPSAPPPALPSVTRPTLREAQEQVDAWRARARTDMAAARTALERLNAEFAPHPLVLHALADLSLAAGQPADAAARAGEAIAVACAGAQATLAATIFRAYARQAAELRLGAADLRATAAVLRDQGAFGAALDAYAQALALDPTDVRTLKILVQMADQLRTQRAAPQQARRVYEMLLERCPGTPLRDYIRAGITACARE